MELSKRLYISEEATGNIIKQLFLAKIINFNDHESNKFQYQPSDKLKILIDNIAELYTTNLVQITNMIHSKRDNQAKKFSDAFIWHKDK